VLKSGDSATLRLPFASSGLNECYGDVSRVDELLYAFLQQAPARGADMRNWLVVSVLLFTASFGRAEHDVRQRTPQIGFFIAIGYARLQSPDEAYIFGGTNLPSGSVLNVDCEDFIGEGSHVVSRDATVTVDQSGLFNVSVAPKQSQQLKNNMICSVDFHRWNQPAAVLKITGRHGERLGNVTSNSQIGTYSGGQYLEAITVLHD
jgi:hypothetical protein